MGKIERCCYEKHARIIYCTLLIVTDYCNQQRKQMKKNIFNVMSFANESVDYSDISHVEMSINGNYDKNIYRVLNNGNKVKVYSNSIDSEIKDRFKWETARFRNKPALIEDYSFPYSYDTRDNSFVNVKFSIHGLNYEISVELAGDSKYVQYGESVWYKGTDLQKAVFIYDNAKMLRKGIYNGSACQVQYTDIETNRPRLVTVIGFLDYGGLQKCSLWEGLVYYPYNW